MSEQWRCIKDYEDLYKISDQGRILGLKRNRILKPAPNEKGYLYVVLCKDGKMKPHRVHRLVAEAFIEGDKSLEVNHKDGNKHNNNASNLEYCSHDQNMKHAIKAGLIGNRKAVAQIGPNGSVIKTFLSVTDAERETGAKCIARACRTEIKAAGYRWKYI